MKIVIDARMYGLEHTGIGRYVINLINQIEKISLQKKDKDRYYLLLRKKYFNSLNFKSKNFIKVLADYPHYSLKEQIVLPLQLFKLKPDLAHFPHFNVPVLWWGKYVVTIHDLIKHQSRGIKTTTHAVFLYWLKHFFYLFIVYAAIKKAFKVITPSNWWKERLIKFYKLSPSKLVVTYEGVDDKFFLKKRISKDNLLLLKKYKIKKPFVVYTGSLYPHKNITRLAQAIVEINKSIPLSLIVVCARSVFAKRFEKEVKKMKAENLVNLIGFLPDKDLNVLYQEAEAFVFPSLLEGFGLTGLEAMAIGLPVVSSNASCLPEVYGEAAFYFNPLDVQDMTEKIKKAVSDKELQEDLIKEGFKKVRQYSWQKMAKETITVYQSIN